MKRPVLIVDDEQDVRKFLSRLLTDNGYDVVTASDGVEAMAAVQEHRPSVILLDLQMPRNTGTDFYRKVRNHKELGSTPVIVVSALAGRNVAVSKGVPVLNKPIDEAALLREVESALALRELST
ncbi:MAG: response regulator [Polyangiaceae bacterium]|jgi:chemosensory pili system protein ChpA (sensor histidine kinase/response regulator)|nr:response regulator [Polyangiaceae bacterium]